MAVLKCKMCGGELAVADNSNICVCDYCGTKQTVPSARDEILSNLFNRANNLRLRSEFDKAQELYEKIVAENPTEAEAYWGIVLCKYGIEYVEDPATKTRIPTCHRTQLQSILADGNYKSAITNADVEQKSIYEEEAGRIDEIQKDILKIVHNEKPFDVFICYKETDENGKRTLDSSIANDIYHQLTQEGFKVFYAAITLEDKLGQEYEPYIFAALNSAKTMLVLGTKPEYFTAVWVRNEWSRFMKLMQNDRSKLLIPCYRDMDAYDLPEEFAHLQAQDMGKIGFINDIVRGIKKVTDTPKAEKETVAVSEGNANIVALKKRGFMSLEDGEWNKADGYFDDALNIDAEDAECYLGKLMVEFKIKKQEDLKKCKKSFEKNNNYQRIIKFDNGNIVTFLKECLLRINKESEIIYSKAVSKLDIAETISDYQELVLIFEELGDFKDAAENLRICKEHIYYIDKSDRKKYLLWSALGAFALLFMTLEYYFFESSTLRRINVTGFEMITNCFEYGDVEDIVAFLIGIINVSIVITGIISLFKLNHNIIHIIMVAETVIAAILEMMLIINFAESSKYYIGVGVWLNLAAIFGLISLVLLYKKSFNNKQAK